MKKLMKVTSQEKTFKQKKNRKKSQKEASKMYGIEKLIIVWPKP